MKPNRVQLHIRKSRAVKQSETNPKNESAITRTVNLGMLRETSSGYTAQISISDDIYSALGQLARAEHGGNWDAALSAALIGALFPAGKVQPFPLSTFESTMQNAGTIIDALLNKVIVANENKMDSRSPAYDPATALEISGYMTLAQRTRKSLAEAFHGVHETLYRPVKL